MELEHINLWQDLVPMRYILKNVTHLAHHACIAVWRGQCCAPDVATSLSGIVLLNCDDVKMGGMASQITSSTIVYSTVYSGADQRKHQSPASLAFVRGIHRGPVNSPHKWSVTRKLFPLDDVIMVAKIRHVYLEFMPTTQLTVEDAYQNGINISHSFTQFEIQ